jgi:hypothetical protein
MPLGSASTAARMSTRLGLMIYNPTNAASSALGAGDAAYPAVR